MADIQMDQVGVKFEIELRDEAEILFDLTNQSGIYFIFQKPDTSKLRQSGSISGNPVNGRVIYVSKTGDLDQTGRWSYQSQLLLPGKVYFTEVEHFKVKDNL